VRRYASAIEAIDHYYALRSCPVPARDVTIESQFARGEPRTEPVGMDELIALSQALDALEGRVTRRKLLVWTHVRYYKATHKEAMAAHNSRVKADGLRADYVESTTIGSWVGDVDRRFEQLLADRGLLIRNAVNPHGVEHEPI
jgi:hypothetical protein